MIPWCRPAATLGGLLALTLAGAACHRSVAPGPDVWAEVNGHPIYRAQVEKYYRSEVHPQTAPSPEEALFLKLNILDELINNELLLERAAKLGLTATATEVEEKFAELRAPYSDAEFQHQLAERGITVEELREDLRRRIAIEKLLNREVLSRVSVSEQELQQAYERNRSEFDVAEPQYHLAQIVVTPRRDPQVRNRRNDDAATEAEARRKIQMIAQRLRQGEDFAELAMDYSEDPTTASTGGDLGFVPRSALGQVDPEARRAILALRPGQTSGIVHVRDGYRIFRLIAVLEPGQRTLADPQVRQMLLNSLRQHKEQLLRAAYLATLRDQAKITNYLARQILESSGGAPASAVAGSPSH
jgi:peptidyl-prolyl cis-trans isomerase SurA